MISPSRFHLLPAFIVASALVVGATAQSQFEFDAASRLAIRDGGRNKPLETFARETVLALTGDERIDDMHPMETLFSLWLGGAHGFDRPWIRVGNKTLREELGLDSLRETFSYQELAQLDTLQAIVDAAGRREATTERLGATAREALAVAQRMQRVEDLVRGPAMRIVPHPWDPVGDWSTPQELGSIYPTGHQAAAGAFRDMLTDYLKKEPLAFSMSAKTLGIELERLSPSVYPPRNTIDHEIRYNRFQPFHKASVLYLIGWLGLLLNTQSKGKRLYMLTGAVLVAGWLLHSYGFYLRCVISHRPPITNAYESVLGAAWGIMFIGLAWEGCCRCRMFALVATPLAGLAMISALRFPLVLPPQIPPLDPGMNASGWLQAGTISFTLSVAAFALGMGLSHILLVCHLGTYKMRRLISALAQRLCRVLQLGVLLMVGGILLRVINGGERAGQIWALIALLGYLVALHGRFAGWMNTFGLAAAAIVCFPGILFAWLGSDFVQGRPPVFEAFGSRGVRFILAAGVVELALFAWALAKTRGQPQP